MDYNPIDLVATDGVLFIHLLSAVIAAFILGIITGFIGAGLTICIRVEKRKEHENSPYLTLFSR